MQPVFQTRLPYDIDPNRSLPGISPLDLSDWLIIDEAFAGQMAIRDALLDQQRQNVLMIDPSAHDAASELLDYVLGRLIGFTRQGDTIFRPDGKSVPIDRADPMGTLGHLIQEDLCILQKHGDEHVLTGAVLCFPASWTLAEKFMRPLIGIHDTVHEYDENIARRVQRLFDGVRVGQGLWRYNALYYASSDLHHPRSVHNRRPQETPQTAPYIRSERQCLVRLPQTGAVIFSIHTYLLRAAGFEQAHRI